jgi:hypothetical protein
MLAWIKIPNIESSNAFIGTTIGSAPNKIIGANSMVWLIMISKTCDRAPAKKSTCLPNDAPHVSAIKPYCYAESDEKDRYKDHV